MGLAPLIGLMALGGLELGREKITDRRNAITGRNRQRATQRGSGAEQTPQAGLLADFGVGDAPASAGGPSTAGDPLRRGGAGDTKFNESGAIFYGGGDLSAAQFLDARYQQDLQSQGEAAQMERQRVSSGPAYMNAQLAREQFERNVAITEDANAKQKKFYNWQIGQGATQYETDALTNPFTPDRNKQAISDGIFARNNTQTPQMSDAYNIDVQQRGQAWEGMEVEDRLEVRGLEDQVRTAERTLKFMDEGSALSRRMDPAARGEIISDWALNSINYLRNKTDAGALQEPDIKLFNEIRGEPDKFFQLTDYQKGRVINLVKNMKSDLGNLNAVHGLNPVSTDAVPANPDSEGGDLKSVDLQSLVDEARIRTEELLDSTAPSLRGDRSRKRGPIGGGSTFINPSIGNPNPRRRGGT